MRRQGGMTLIGMVLTMAVVVIAGIVVMRAVPVYIRFYEVKSSVRALNTLPTTEFTTDPSSNAHYLRTKLMNQLYVNSIESITPEQINIIPDGTNAFKITIKYQEIRPLIANIRLLFDFSLAEKVIIHVD